MRLQRFALTCAAATVAALLATTPSAEAWPKEAYRNMVYDTMRMMPPRLARVLLARDDAVLRGVVSLEGETASILARDGRDGKLSADLMQDVETRKQIHVIREALARLAVEFNRFDDRLKDLARHIRQAHEDVEKIQVTGGKITQQFLRIESAELDQDEPKPVNVVELREENKGSK